MGFRDLFHSSIPPPLHEITGSNGQLMLVPPAKYSHGKKMKKGCQRDIHIPQFVPVDRPSRRAPLPQYPPPFPSGASREAVYGGSQPRLPSMPYHPPNEGGMQPGHHSLQGGPPMPPPGPGMPPQHPSLQGGAPLAAPELRSRGESMQAQHGSSHRRPTGGVSRHDFANQAPGHAPLRHGQIPEGAPLPTGFVDPLKTQSAPKPKGHYGMREHVPGMTALNVERHGRADDPAANFGLVSEIRRVHERARGGRYGNANGDARGSVVDPRVGRR